jgi:transitional endoplasmic reticulum ATPase
MRPGDDAIAGLREALRVSPNNLPLRQHLADTLCGLGRYEESEAEYKAALGLSPDNDKLKIALARAFFLQGKNSAALVIVEEMLKSSSPPGAALVLHAKLLERAGDIERAVRQYKRGVAEDSAAADSEFAGRLGIRVDRDDAGGDESGEVIDGRVRSASEPEGGPGVAEIEKPKIKFKDVGGMDAVKDDIRMKIIHPLAHPELYKAYGKTIGGGILMYGPPGCGKTHLARATAGEINANFISVGINDVLEMWLGNSERNLHQLFQQARRNKPCVLFFDEVDALAASRADMRHSAARHMINQFLAEMDGIEAANEGVLILAATNAPWHVDAAFRRPGRFDRILFVPPPDVAARAAILRIQLTGKPVEGIDHEHLAKKTEAFSGADLKAIVDTAIEEKLRAAIKLGRPEPLTTRDLAAAAASIKPSTKEWFATARNYALYSNQGGAYDDILKYLKM